MKFKKATINIQLECLMGSVTEMDDVVSLEAGLSSAIHAHLKQVPRVIKVELDSDRTLDSVDV